MKVNRHKVIEKDKAESTAVAVSYDEPERITGLVERAAGGDFEAFGELYGTYLNRIYRYVLCQVRDKMIAEDISEDVFVKAWKAIGSYRGNGQAFSSWLYRIAHNHMVDNLRSSRRFLSTEIETSAEVGDPGLEAEGRLEREALLEEISCLPQNQKQVIMLKFIEGLDNSEIGKVIGKSQGAIRVLQMRAFVTLRERLKRGKQGDGN